MSSDFHRRASPIVLAAPTHPIPAAILDRPATASQTAITRPEVFLGLGISPDDLWAAQARAHHNGTSLHEDLIAAGRLDAGAYAHALADALQVPCLASADGVVVIEARTAPRHGLREVVARIDERPVHVLDAQSLPPAALEAHIARLRDLHCDAVLAPAEVVDTIDENAHAAARLDHATNDLRRRMPAGSAAGRWRRHQVLLPIIFAGLVIGGLLVAPERTLAVSGLLMGIPFLSVTVLRLIAFREVLVSRQRRARPRAGRSDRALPRYSVLVPLYRETEVLPDLIAALAALDYPASRLDVLLLIEATDLAMQSALLVQPVPTHFRVLVVPDGHPRTKPKALNYGLQFAKGDLVVVFDAEDRPQPQQLRRAAELFARGPANLACLQAQLNIYNPRDSWFTRQFTIEYSTLFDAVLPALERLELPIPLGGTSNHFRRNVLEAIGAWDPFNVTEDADLGIRIARFGYATCIMPSTTWEEAPGSFRVWLPQRTRWLKGWMQTWLVHTREPGALAARLGVIGAAGVHTVMGGLIVSALVQPLFIGLLAYQLSAGTLLDPSDGLLETGLLWISLSNLAVGYLVSMVIGVLSVAQRGRYWLGPSALLMPLYWLLISLAAYRALYQLVRTPYSWEKTPHGAARRRNCKASL